MAAVADVIVAAMAVITVVAIAPMIAESEQTSSMADALPSVSSAINSLSMSEKQQFQSTFSNTTKATVTTCDDLIDISDEVTNDSGVSSANVLSTDTGNENSSSPKTTVSIYAPDPKIAKNIRESRGWD